MLDGISVGLDAGERIAGSTAPALVLCVLLLVVACVGVWVTVRRQRKWIQARLASVERGLLKCEASHKLCVARGARRTSLLLQVLALAEPLVDALRRQEDVTRIKEIRRKVEALLREEAEEAEADAAAESRVLEAELSQ